MGLEMKRILKSDFGFVITWMLVVICVLAAMAWFAFGARQSGATGSLLNYPKFKAFDSSGIPLAGGLLYTYVAGSSTAKAAYADAACTVAAANPVVLDSDGEATIYLNGKYKLVLKTSDGTTLWTMDNIEGMRASSPNLYYVDSSETDQGVAGSGRSVKDLVDAIGTSTKATLVFTHDGSGVTTGYTFTSALTFPANIHLQFENGAQLDGAAGVTPNCPAAIIAQPNQQVFGGSGTIAFTDPGIVPVGWFGTVGDNTTDDTSALQRALTASGSEGIARLRRGRIYKVSSMLTAYGSIDAEPGIMDGSGVPTINYTGSGATVIQVGDYQSGWKYEGFRIDMRNSTANATGMYFSKGLVKAQFNRVGILCASGVSGNGIVFKGGDGAGNKYDVSINTFNDVVITNPTYGIQTTDPDAGGSGGEMTFNNVFVSNAQTACFLTTGRGNTWIGGDFGISGVSGTGWSFPGDYATGNNIIGASCELPTAAQYAVTIPASNDSASGIVNWLGGKIYTGGAINDLGVGSKKRRFTRINDEDGLGGLEGKAIFLRGLDAMQSEIGKMTGIIGNSNDQFLVIRSDDLITAAQIMLATAQSSGATVPPKGMAFVAGGGDDANRINFAYSLTGVTVTKIASVYPGSHGIGARRFFPEAISAAERSPNITTSLAMMSGTGSPESGVTAPVGSLYLRSDGGANTTLYIKESGTGPTGWVAK